jgi:lipoprotein-anchoring transpeptidase ErfK/SrfK
MPDDQNLEALQPDESVDSTSTQHQPVVMQPDQVRLLPKITWTHFQAVRLRHRRERWAIALLLPLIVLTALASVAYGSTFNLSAVRVASIPVSRATTDTQLQKAIDSKTGAYKFSLVSPDGKDESFSLADAGIKPDAKETIQDVRALIRGLGWQRFAWWQQHTVKLVIDKNDKVYQSFVDQHIAIANQPAVDASLSTVKGSSVITEGTNGWTYSLPKGNEQLARAAAELKPLKAELAKTAVAPALKAKDLVSAKTTLDNLLKHTVTFQLPERTVMAKASDIAGWLDIQPAPTHKTVDVSVNSGKILAWLDKATRGDIRPPRSQITTTDAAGSTTVLISGQNGMDITNKNSAVSGVATQLAKSSPEITTNLEVAYKSFSTINAADYPKWIVADVTTKRMYAYEHATLVRSFLISAGAPKTPTVLGTYQIFSKYISKDMRGNNADGSRYFQPHVRYVNYFYRDYAIHGNYWRPSSYFGNINSSHGCVGITDSDAEWLYNWAPIGTTVITHA